MRFCLSIDDFSKQISQYIAFMCTHLKIQFGLLMDRSFVVFLLFFFRELFRKTLKPNKLVDRNSNKAHWKKWAHKIDLANFKSRKTFFLIRAKTWKEIAIYASLFFQSPKTFFFCARGKSNKLSNWRPSSPFKGVFRFWHRKKKSSSAVETQHKKKIIITFANKKQSSRCLTLNFYCFPR